MTRAAFLAIDQGTTSSRAIVYSDDGREVARAQQEFPQLFPHDGWVEHDPEEIWKSVVTVCRTALHRATEDGHSVVAAGITNQRETTVVWDRESGKPVSNAIVWQDRRGAGRCRELRIDGYETLVRDRTGLLIDSYFSATKLEWLLKNIEGAQTAARKGRLAFGTIDSFLLWRLTGGRAHATDATNASRTMLFDIGKQDWDDDLLALFEVPDSILPEVKDNAGKFGVIQRDILGAEIPITGMAGDQQAAAIGQACITKGMTKSTYGTGCFVLINQGQSRPSPNEGILATVAYRLNKETHFALEGSILNAGTAIHWLRDNLGLISDASETEAMAASFEGNKGVYFVPAFTGLGAPIWDPDARGAMYGLTRDTGRAEIVRAALEAVAFQTADLLDVMGGVPSESVLRVDGGMVVNNWLMQFLADVCGCAVERPIVTETTALGVAMLAGLGSGHYSNLDEIASLWALDRRFEPIAERAGIGAARSRWTELVARTAESRH